MITPRSAPQAAATARWPPGVRRSTRGPLLAGLGISVTLHVLAFLLLRFHAPVPGGHTGPQPPERAWPAQVAEVVNLRVVSSDVPPAAEPERPPPRLDIALPAFPPPTPVEADPGAAPGTPIPSVRERLSANAAAARLSAPPRALLDPTAPVRTLEDEIAELAFKLGIHNDSILAEWERVAAATDWTITDSQGGRWGVSPGKLHLGGLTLPLPIGFAPSADVAARIGTFEQIQRQAAAASARGTLEDRGKAVRARVDAARKKNGGG